MKLRLFCFCAGLALHAGCAATPQSQWTPVVDTYGNSRAQYLTRDMEECRALAMRASGTTGEQATRGAVTGGLIGAAGGAALGGILGGSSRDARRGAGAGAVAGGITGGVRGNTQTQTSFERAFNNCLRQRGHNVISD